MSQYEDFGFLQQCAKEQTIPEKEMIRLSNHSNRFIRWIIANYALTPQWLLEKLANDDHWSVRYAVACNSGTAKDVVKYRLALDTDGRVREAAEENPIIDKLDRKEIVRMRLERAYEGDFTLIRR